MIKSELDLRETENPEPNSQNSLNTEQMTNYVSIQPRSKLTQKTQQNNVTRTAAIPLSYGEVRNDSVLKVVIDQQNYIHFVTYLCRKADRRSSRHPSTTCALHRDVIKNQLYRCKIVRFFTSSILAIFSHKASMVRRLWDWNKNSNNFRFGLKFFGENLVFFSCWLCDKKIFYRVS